MRRPPLRKSLTVNAVSLMTATVVTNAFGFIFWAVAARLEPTRVVGRAAATVAALVLLATIAQINLTNVFVRLLPAAGRLSSGFVRRGYLAVIVTGLVVTAVYVSSGLSASVVHASWGTGALMSVGVVVLAIFTLEDAVLTALRLTPWVPLENISTALARLALLPVLTLLPLGSAITVSWVLPAALAAMVVNYLLFRKALPALQGVEGTLPGRRRLMSFVAGEFVGNLFATATLQLMPLVIAWRLGTTQLAYFTLPWLISMGISLLLWNVAFSFAVELVGEHGGSAMLLRRTMLLWLAVVIGAMVVCVLGAVPLLSLAGAKYAAHGSTLLRLIGISAPFTAVVTLYTTLAWIDQHVWLLAAIQAAAGLALVLVTVALLPHVGLPAAGWANLGTQGVAAALMAPLALRRLRRGQLVGAR